MQGLARRTIYSWIGGEEFEASHGIEYPHFEMHAMAFSHGTPALDHLLE